MVRVLKHQFSFVFLVTAKRLGRLTLMTKFSTKVRFAKIGLGRAPSSFTPPRLPTYARRAALRRSGLNPAKVNSFWIVFGMLMACLILVLRWRTKTRVFCGFAGTRRCSGTGFFSFFWCPADGRSWPFPLPMYYPSTEAF